VSILAGVAIFVALAIATLTIEKLADGPINWMFARVFGGLGANRKAGIKGTWSAAYEYQDPANKKHKVEQILHVRQYRSYVSAKAISSTGPHLHQIRAKLDGRILTGTWRNVKEGAHHHGAFQLVLRTDGKVLSGHWVGFDRKNRIQHGDYTWHVLSREYSQILEGSGGVGNEGAK
jgi:hypothetical protein